MTRHIRRLLAGITVAVVAAIAFPVQASAHPLSTSAVVLDVGADQVHATVELPLDQLSTALGQSYDAANVTRPATLAQLRTYVEQHLGATDSSGETWATSVTGGHVESVDGTDHLVLEATLTPASGAVGDFDLHYDAIIESLQSHRVFVTARYGDSGPFTTLVMLSWQRTSVPVAASASSPGSGVSLGSMVRLGTEHIAGGYDHLLFLTMLLLPVPLLVRRRGGSGARGGLATGKRVAVVATSFTLGHSITLALVSFGVLHLPERPVETLVALSIAVAAVHSVRPLVSRGEALIAAGFGLVHGGAFATTILELNLSRRDTMKAVLGFNLGIEAAQLLVIAAIVPVLYAASAHTAYYRRLLVGLACTSVLCTLDWIQAIWRDTTPHVDSAFKVLADHPYATWTALAVLATGLWVSRPSAPSSVPAVADVQAPAHHQVLAGRSR